MSTTGFAGLLAAAGEALPALALKTALLLAAAALLALALRRHSAALRHLVWAVAVAGVLALPFAQLVPLRLAVLPASLAGAAAPQEAVAPPVLTEPHATLAEPAPVLPTASGEAGFRFPPKALLLGVWLLGAAVLLLRLLVGTGTAWWLARRGERIDDPRWTATADRISRAFDAPSARLVRSRWTEMPMTWGFLRPVILLPAGCDAWPDERRDVVLRHELAHVARRDVLTLALAEVARAVHWFNPLSWMALHQLRAEAERCCDDLVLQDGTRPSSYADHLLEMVRLIGRARVPAAVALPMAQRSTFEGRLLAILEPGIERGSPGRGRALATAGGLLALVLALGTLRPAEAAGAGGAAAGLPAPAGAESTAADAEPVPPGRGASGARGQLRTPRGSDDRGASAPAPLPAPAADPAGSAGPAGRAAADTLTPEQLIAMRAVGVTAGYVAEIRALLGPLTADQIVSLRAVGVTPSYVNDLRGRGYSPSLREVTSLRAVGVDAAYIEAMQAAGYRRMTLEELTALRAVGVTPAYVQEMARLGLRDLPIRDLKGMRAVGVDPQYVQTMRAAGYGPLTAEQLTSLRAVGVTPAYLQEMTRLGYRDLPLEQVTGMRAVGVTPEYVAELAAAGLGRLDARTLTNLRAVGVNGAYIRELAGEGLRGLSVRELTSLRAHGVTAGYIREMRGAGFGPLSADQLIRLRASGTDRELLESRRRERPR